MSKMLRYGGRDDLRVRGQLGERLLEMNQEGARLPGGLMVIWSTHDE